MSGHPFRAAVESGDFDRLGTLFAPDAVLHSPIAHRPYQGCDFVHTREDGLLDAITVMVRPLKAATVFAERMRAALSS